MDSKLSPTKVANLVSVSASTVRRLTGLYADYFSPDATPAPGGRRFYTEEDVETLRLVIDLQNAGVSEPDIIARLDRGITLPSQATDVAIDVLKPPPALPQPQIVKVDTTELQRAIERQADVEFAHVEALQLHAQAMDRLADRLVWIVAAILLIALLVVAVAVGWIG